MTGLTHLDENGAARMVDVGGKAPSARSATAKGRIAMSAEALAAIRAGDAPKGDVIAAARIAGIMAAKKTAELMRERDRELERMINRDRRLLVLLAVFVVGLFAAGAALWMG